jgi:hypothetical protein
MKGGFARAYPVAEFIPIRKDVNVSKATVSLSHLLRGVATLAAVGAFGAFLVFNPIVSSIIGGMVAGNALQARAEDEVRERSFRTSCALYKKATTWERWSTPIHWSDSWCEDYIGRM